MNQVVLSGVVTEEPELKYSQGGKAYCNLTIQTDDGGGYYSEVPLVMFGKAAEETANSGIVVGMFIEVTGAIQSQKKEGRDGQEWTNISVKAFRINLPGAAQA